MKKLLLVTLISLISFTVLSQSCLPEGITFSTQEQIDNFQADNPGCTEIEGSVIIQGGNISNLNGLSVLTAIGGNLSFYNNHNLLSLQGLDNILTVGYLSILKCDSLTNLDGLDNLNTINGELRIDHNQNIADLSGLNNLNTIQALQIIGNPMLTSISLLENITSAEGDILIASNPNLENLQGLNNITHCNVLLLGSNHSLTNLSGLNSLITVSENLVIGNNDSLENLSGLENLTFIGNELRVVSNLKINSLTGLENVGSINGDISIQYNPLLTECEIQSICNYLSNPTGSVNIYNNGESCNNPSIIASNCGFSIDCLPFGNYYFTSQNEIDEFQVNYPDCNELEGDAIISGLDITDLSGLNIITHIGGDFKVVENSNLSSFTGLENLTTVGKSLEIGYWGAYGNLKGNPSLINLDGLNGLNSVGENLHIIDNDSLLDLNGLMGLNSIAGGLAFVSNEILPNLNGLNNLVNLGNSLEMLANPSLLDINGLESLSIIGGELNLGGSWFLDGNHQLSTLSGLSNVTSIAGNIYISHNISLSMCAIKSICDSIENSTQHIWLHNNALGCNTLEEIEEACETVYVDEVNQLDKLITSPNPFTTSTTIEYELQQPEKISLSIYNHLGQLVYQTQENQSQGKQQLLWNGEGYTDGIYYYRLQAGEQVANGKMVKVK